MAELRAFAPGLYPRSEALVQATRDLDRGRTTQDAVDEQVERDLAELERAESGESDADRWQLEQRIRHAENQLNVAGRA